MEMEETVSKGIFHHDGKWMAQVRIGKKTYRREFSIRKYGNYEAMRLANEAREELFSKLLTPETIRCHSCRTEIDWLRIGTRPKFCSNKCRQAYFWNSYKDVTGLNYKNRHGGLPQPAPYERPDIPDEFETEIPLLLSKWNAVPLDVSNSDREDGNHSFIASDCMTPLEALMLKEEIESEEHRQRLNDIILWERFQKRENPTL